MTYPIGFVPGVFDLLHQGHLNLIHRARALCDCLVVGVVSDQGTAAYKRPPIQDEQTRLAVVRALRMVDFALLQPTTDPSPIVELLRPQALFHGDDWEKLLQGQETLERLGVEFIRLPYTPGVSTTILVERMP